MYQLIYSKKALKELKKLDKVTRTRIISSLERMRLRPHSYVKKLVESAYFRLRVGDYRIILEINGNKLLILVINVKHRKNVYSKL